MAMQSRYAWKAKTRKLSRRLVLKAGTVPLAVATGGSAFGIFRSQAGRIALPGTFIGSVDISGLSQQEASELLESYWVPYIENPVVFGHEGSIWTPSAAEVGIRVDLAEGLRAAYASERLRVFLWFTGLKQQNQVELPAYLNTTVAFNFLNAIGKQIDRPPVNSYLDRQDNQVRVLPGEEGKWLDRDAALRLLNIPQGEPQRQKIDLPVETLIPPITLQMAENAKSAFDRFFEQGLRFELAGDAWQVNGNTLTAWIGIYQDPEQGRLELMGEPKMLHEWLDQVSVEATRPPKNARFTVRDKEVLLEAPAEVGYRTKTDTLVATAQAAIQQGLTALYLPADVEQPMYTAKNMLDWNFENLLAEGTSLFAGSPPERAHNIALAALKLHGYVVPPGETFSFLEVLGPITHEDGYQASLVIFGDQTVPGVGGGVCQVSTTMFRAAFWAGLPITERNQHSYRVGYYERDGSPPGFDAAVYDPGLDLKFVNDSDNPILIQTHVDEEEMTLKFALHGRPSNRFVRMLPAIAKNWIPHGPPLPDKLDPELPLGERLQIEWAADGVDAQIQREIVVDNEKRFDAFSSRYRPWQERWLVGTKLVIPEEQAEPPPQPSN
jgi:vancomycin resistance protein YoaR